MRPEVTTAAATKQHSSWISVTPAPCASAQVNRACSPPIGSNTWILPKKKKTSRSSFSTAHSFPQPNFSDSNPFTVLEELEGNTVCIEPYPPTLIVGDSIVRNVQVKNTVVECFPGARVSDINSQIPTLLDKHDADTIIVHVGTNDISLRETETLKQDFNILLSTLRSFGKKIMFSGPIPRFRKGIESFSRLTALNLWLKAWCKTFDLVFIDNFDTFWQRPSFFRKDGIHPNGVGSAMLSGNISCVLNA
ncbi:homeodomain-interacting protein kinase 2-like [Astyanax mexicanus]|uniref:Homeodomain-interacting protein kinase 2-like n=1 Tax=Astyanax mexicanus TaxID=7994 RepID=A0A8T2KJ75_ASTMX|nr:homeodomain-interacting protein kinase 2-like [Astyanax mexicanus]